MVPKMPVMPPPVKMRMMIAVRVPIPRKISKVRPRITPAVATPAPVGHRIRYHNRYRPDTGFSPACFPLQTGCSGSRRSCLSPCCCFSTLAGLLAQVKKSLKLWGILQKKSPEDRGFRWWPERGSNPRHEDFQSSALPTELSGRPRIWFIYNFFADGKHFFYFFAQFRNIFNIYLFCHT